MQHTASGLGLRLQAAREAKGLTIAEVASVTRISERSIQAMERERFHTLPGGIFRRSYVRALAEAVGLDGPACVRCYIQHFEPPDADTADVLPVDWPRPGVAIAVATVLAAILCLAAAFAES
jgi:cytoskeletal protein RodZ